MKPGGGAGMVASRMLVAKDPWRTGFRQKMWMRGLYSSVGGDPAWS